MLEDILCKYFGFSGEIGDDEWCKAYDKLVDLVYALGCMGVLNGEKVVNQLDEIDSSSGDAY